MFFWEVVWMDLDGNTHSMFALRGELTALEANRKLLVIFPAVRQAVKRKGGRIIDAQIVFCTRKHLYDPDETFS